MRPPPGRPALLEFALRLFVCSWKRHRWSSRAQRGEAFDAAVFADLGSAYALEFGQRRCSRCGKAGPPSGI